MLDGRAGWLKLLAQQGHDLFLSVSQATDLDISTGGVKRERSVVGWEDVDVAHHPVEATGCGLHGVVESRSEPRLASDGMLNC